PRKEVEDKICFGFQCKYRNWLKVKVKLLQNIHANANANTIITNVSNDNNLTMSGGDKLFINFLKSTYTKPLYVKDKIMEPVNVQVLFSLFQKLVTLLTLNKQIFFLKKFVYLNFFCSFFFFFAMLLLQRIHLLFCLEMTKM
ncbi:hypothetical protein RFI_36085, partial [Reticulomyxa filosa]